MKIYKHQIESFIILLACLNITYFNNMIPKLSTILFLLRLVLLGYIFANLCVSKQKISKTMISLLCLSGWIMLVTLFMEGLVIDVLRAFSIPLLLSLYIDWKRNNINLLSCIDVWLKVLSVLIIVDFVSMFLYPNGMYADSMYSLNWVLGYKTARLVFSLPCCVLATIVSIKKYNKITWKTYLCYIISVGSLYYSQATAASISLLVACVGMIIVYNGKYLAWLWKIIINFKIVIPIYAIITFLIVYIQNSPTVQYIITQVLKKDATLTTRTYIWNHCIEILKEHPFTGVGYLSVQQYQKITNNMYATSAHNMSLTILMCGGVLGMLLYIWVMVNSWNNFKRNATGIRKVLSIGVLAILLVGLTSSSIVFSFCGFFFFNLMEAFDESA